MGIDLSRYGFTQEMIKDIAEITSDPMLFCAVALKIQDKLGQLSPLHFNEPQIKLYREYWRQKALGQPIRIIILKARQMGFSTAVSGIFYWETTFRENINTMIVAHKSDASTNIFNKNKLFFEKEPEFLQPLRKASNAKELLFENPTVKPSEKRRMPGLMSKIVIETALNKEAGRSMTIQNLHISELAFWPYPETLISLMQATPDEPGSAVIIESTANGIGGDFYELWQKALRGENSYAPLFFPWFEMSSYCRPVPPDFKLDPEEQEIKRLYKLTDGQLVWRRWCIQNNCGGNLDTFHQEYPATPEEAFIASGRPVFDTNKLNEALRKAKEPPEPCIGRVVNINGLAQFQVGHRGYLKVWQWPEDGRDYVLGVDSALGKAESDFSVIEVIDRATKEQVAEWHGHIDPDLLGVEAVFLGRFYNNAWIIPETNGVGTATVLVLRNLHYPNLYRRMTINKITNKRTIDYGFVTSPKSKPIAVAALSAVIREETEKIKSAQALRECLTYIIDNEGKTNAQSGCHDDRVMALALAYCGIGERPWENSVILSDEIIAGNMMETYGGVSEVTGY